MQLDVFLGKISVQVPTYYYYYYNLYFITGSLSLQVVFQWALKIKKTIT